MIWQSYVAIIAVAVVVVCWIGYVFFSDNGWWLGVGCGVALVALIFGVAGLTIGLGRHYNRINCDQFSAQTGRVTKFVIYNTWSSGECLTPSGKGTWIPTSGLREFGSTP